MFNGGSLTAFSNPNNQTDEYYNENIDNAIEAETPVSITVDSCGNNSITVTIENISENSTVTGEVRFMIYNTESTNIHNAVTAELVSADASVDLAPGESKAVTATGDPAGGNKAAVFVQKADMEILHGISTDY